MKNIKIKNKSRVIIITTAVVLIIALSTFLIVDYANNKTYNLKYKYSFSTTRYANFTLNDEEKTNINKYLENMVYEDENFYGFSGIAKVIDFYNINALFNLLTEMGNETIIQDLISKLPFFENYDFSNLSFLDLVYFINISKIMNLAYNTEKIYSSLQKFYDSDTGLFFPFAENDFINVKIVATILLCKSLPEISTKAIFNIKDAITSIFTSYSFKNPSEKSTFYNSGGDIIYALSVLNLTENVNLSNLAEWFTLWNNEYKTLSINNFQDALQFSNFYDIAIIFDPNYSNEKLQNFYDALATDKASEVEDYLMFYNIIKNVDHTANTNFNTELLRIIKSNVDENNYMFSEISLIDTVYGVMLAINSGFSLNKEKLNNYVRYNYYAIEQTNNISDATNILYYNLILEQQVNNYNVQYDSARIQKIINDLLKSFKYKDNLVDDIILTSQIVEIISDLQAHNANIKISYKQRDKISKAVKKLLEDDDKVNSYLIIDLFYIDDLLNLELIPHRKFLSVHDNLLLDKGNRMYNVDGVPADILTTYNFEACMNVFTNYGNLDDKKEYVAMLKESEGIYMSYIGSGSSEINLMSVFCGNAINKIGVYDDSDNNGKK
ncbi:MAG: hypothetical protein LBE09_07525 [Christensenellaceae bacterium]|jgi:hypothetical protein|nr:hypothetical protein [Christensenellaceae bacterium]